ncbi:MAG: glycosyltransferase family 2 protein [Verrucomicrobia bacterium]|nr:glycosyltransferase family 2 protein [Verrucomicrobiota bacterium]
MIIDIILPVYEEAEGLPIFHKALSVTLAGLMPHHSFRMIYVLDRCRDNSLEVLKGIAIRDARVTVIHLSRRFGHQMSLIAGLDHSDGDASILMDCDMQHPPELIPRLLEKFEAGYDVVQAIRTHDSKIHPAKQWTSRVFYKIQNLLSPIEIPVGAADFRLISRKVRNVFQSAIREQNQFLRGLFQWVGFRQATVEFVSLPRGAGATKYPFLNLLTFSITGITSFSKVPLRSAAVVGFIISALSVLYGLFAITVYLTVGHLPPGYTSLIVTVSFMGGLQLTVLGILGEYLGAVFDEVKRRPLYIVDELIGRSVQAAVDSYARFDRSTKAYPGAGDQCLCMPAQLPIPAERSASQRGVARRFRSGYHGHTRKRRRLEPFACPR